ncbi:MAG: hypothetical protein R3F43_15400 [bacterium]
MRRSAVTVSAPGSSPSHPSREVTRTVQAPLARPAGTVAKILLGRSGAGRASASSTSSPWGPSRWTVSGAASRPVV